MSARLRERAGDPRAVALAGALAVVLVLLPLAVLVRTQWPPLLDADKAVTVAAERAVGGSPALLAAARAVTLLGDPRLLTALAVVVSGALAARGQVRPALFLLAVRAITAALSAGMKIAVDRTRPVFDVPVDSALGASFPSGHTLAAAGVWTALAVLLLPAVRPGRRRWLLGAALAVAVLVAASRVLLGVHYLSDVVGALLLGTGVTALCAAVLVRWQVERGVRVDRVADAVSGDEAAGAARPGPGQRP